MLMLSKGHFCLCFSDGEKGNY